jgi:hypothetical protein
MAICALEAIDDVSMGLVDHILSMGIGYDLSPAQFNPSGRQPAEFSLRNAHRRGFLTMNLCRALVSQAAGPDELQAPPDGSERRVVVNLVRWLN